MSKRKVPSSDILIELYVNQKKNAREIGDMYNVMPGNVLIQLKKLGIEIRQDKGKNHHNWKGGRIIKGDGYYGIWIPTHERADNQGYVYEHTLIIEKNTGRLPQKNEVVHHIDIDKLNNDIENLIVCDSREHLEMHRSIEMLIKPLLEKGVIEFDREEKKYKIK